MYKLTDEETVILKRINGSRIPRIFKEGNYENFLPVIKAMEMRAVYILKGKVRLSERLISEFAEFEKAVDIRKLDGEESAYFSDLKQAFRIYEKIFTGPMAIKSLGREYIFHPGEIVVMKKDKVIRVIHHDEIKKITYNPKFELKDFISTILAPSASHIYTKCSFDITLKLGKVEDGITICISSDEFERIKATFKIPIEVI